MDNWKDISVKEKMQIINGSILVYSAIILYFISFIITLEIGYNIIAAGSTLLATGLAFFGITSYIKNQIIEFQAKVTEKLERMEKMEENRKKEKEDD